MIDAMPNASVKKSPTPQKGTSSKTSGPMHNGGVGVDMVKSEDQKCICEQVNCANGFLWNQEPMTCDELGIDFLCEFKCVHTCKCSVAIRLNYEHRDAVTKTSAHLPNSHFGIGDFDGIGTGIRILFSNTVCSLYRKRTERKGMEVSCPSDFRFEFHVYFIHKNHIRRHKSSPKSLKHAYPTKS